MNPIAPQIDHSAPADTHDMVVIHRAFRRESRLGAGSLGALGHVDHAPRAARSCSQRRSSATLP
jgi:hypothetical protein